LVTAQEQEFGVIRSCSVGGQENAAIPLLGLFGIGNPNGAFRIPDSKVPIRSFLRTISEVSGYQTVYSLYFKYKDDTGEHDTGELYLGGIDGAKIHPEAPVIKSNMLPLWPYYQYVVEAQFTVNEEPLPLGDEWKRHALIDTGSQVTFGIYGPVLEIYKMVDGKAKECEAQNGWGTRFCVPCGDPKDLFDIGIGFKLPNGAGFSEDQGFAQFWEQEADELGWCAGSIRGVPSISQWYKWIIGMDFTWPYVTAINYGWTEGAVREFQIAVSQQQQSLRFGEPVRWNRW